MQHSHHFTLKRLRNIISLCRPKYSIGLLSTTIMLTLPSLDASLIEESFIQNNDQNSCHYGDACQPAKFFVIGEYLQWQSNISGLELCFGRSNITEDDTNDVSISEASEFDIDPHFKWDPGYRVGVGMQLPNSNISFATSWTQYNGKGNRTICATNDIINHGHVKVSLKQLDAVFSYNYALPTINIEPFVGIRFTKINHCIKSSVTTNITVLPSTLATSLIDFDDYQHFKGVGPSLKLYGDWEIGCGFGIYGEAGFSLLYGDYTVNFNDSRVNSAPFSSESTANAHQHLHRFNNMVDLSLGIFWNTSICNGTDINVSLGYECHEYFGLSYLGSYPGDITFHGGVLAFEIGF